MIHEFDSVTVDISPVYLAPDTKAFCHFWIALDVSANMNDAINHVERIAVKNDEIPVRKVILMPYLDSRNMFHKGMPRIGLSLMWEWDFKGEWDIEQNTREIFLEAERRSFKDIKKIVSLLKTRGVPISGQAFHSAKDVWLNYFRPAIDALMAIGHNAWPPALSLSVLCIDAAYQDKFGKQKGSYTQKMLRWMFGPYIGGVSESEQSRLIRLIANGFANGLKHDTFIREPIILSDRFEPGNVLLPPFQAGEHFNGDEFIIVSPALWWQIVSKEIDHHYAQA